MTAIFSNKQIAGLEGKYMNPKYFDGNFDGCDIIYTKSDVITKEANKQGLNVLSFDEKVKTPKSDETKKVEEKTKGPLNMPKQEKDPIVEAVEAGVPDEVIIEKFEISKRKLSTLKKNLKK